MFAIRRISRTRLKWVSQISTSSSLNCDDPKPEDRKMTVGKKKEEKEVSDKKKSAVGSKKLFTPPTVSEEEKKLAREKLKELLLESKSIGDQPESAKPVKVTQSGRLRKPRAAKLAETFEKTLSRSAKEVASEIGGDAEKTESDLLNVLKKQKILGTPEPKPDDKPFAVKDQKKRSVAKAVSDKMSKILLEIDKVEIKSDKSTEAEDQDTVSPFQFKTYNFQKKEDEEVRLKLWDEMEERELQFLVKHPPRNHFEELILWTEQGRLWQFPIDNDQGREDEAQVDFTEHVFLEEYLEPWCPPSGPLRHFMDLVLVGLSKNPYLTVEDKKEHIYWYRDYFESKKKLLMELGAFTGRKDVKELPDNKQEV